MLAISDVCLVYVLTSVCACLTWEWLERIRGCLARHSLQVFSLRHWSWRRGVGEQDDWPMAQPVLRRGRGEEPEERERSTKANVSTHNTPPPRLTWVKSLF